MHMGESNMLSRGKNELKCAAIIYMEKVFSHFDQRPNKQFCLAVLQDIRKQILQFTLLLRFHFFLL
jgi:hypothetical protein